MPAVSVVICTYNRADLLPGAIDNVLAQDGPFADAFELIVVDNNSTDGTRGIVDAVAARDRRVRYLFEGAQGLSHARNAGIAAARAPIITFTDDDVRVGPRWIAAILEVCAEHPEADVIGGRVLPDWPAPPPRWLTASHWSPLALVDYGEEPVRVSAENPLCLVGANLSVRRRAFDLVGGFAPALQSAADALDFVVRAIEKAGYKPTWSTNRNNTTDTVAKFFKPVADAWEGANGVSVTWPDTDFSQETKDCNTNAAKGGIFKYTPDQNAYAAYGQYCIMMNLIAQGLKDAKGSLTPSSFLAAMLAIGTIPSNSGPAGTWAQGKYDAGDYVYPAKYSKSGNEGDGGFLPVGGTAKAVKVPTTATGSSSSNSK